MKLFVHKSICRGSMIMEIILSLAIFSIICMPILAFIFSSEEFQSKSMRAEAESYAKKAASNLQWFRLPNINGYSNRHSCDGAMAEYASATAPSVTYPTGFQHERNFITSIRNVFYDNERYLILGTNSASTTDPDLYALSGDAGSVIRSMETGPGIVDFDISSGYLYAVERSVVQPLWRISLNDLFDSSASSSSVTGIPISLLGALPLKISAMKDWLFLGTDKSTAAYGELLILKRIPDTDSFSMHLGHEFDAGINNIVYTPYELLVATPNDYEVMGLLLNNPPYAASGSLPTETPLIPTDQSGLIVSRKFDASGSAGNGKSLAAYKNEAYMGRTVGNVEFYKLRNLLDDVTTSSAPFSAATFIDADRTILQIEEIFGGAYIAMLIKTTQPALRVYEKKPSGSYAMTREVLLPSTPTAMTCTRDSFAIGLESTTTPIAIIKF